MIVTTQNNYFHAIRKKTPQTQIKRIWEKSTRTKYDKLTHLTQNKIHTFDLLDKNIWEFRLMISPYVVLEMNGKWNSTFKNFIII